MQTSTLDVALILIDQVKILLLTAFSIQTWYGQKYWGFKLTNNISVSFQDLDEGKQGLPKDKGNVFMLLKGFMKEVSKLFCVMTQILLLLFFFLISNTGTRTLHVDHVNVFKNVQ